MLDSFIVNNHTSTARIYPC